MKKSFILALATATVASSLQAQFSLATFDFDTYASGESLNGDDWKPKWQGGSDQQNLFTGSGLGTAILDTSIATTNYHMPSTTGFSLTGADTATIQVDFRYTLAAGVLGYANKGFFALGITNEINWWAGNPNFHAVANRGMAIGTTLPVSPWVQQWIPHNSVGITGVTNLGGGQFNIAEDTTSNWLTLRTSVDVVGGFYRIKSDIYNAEGTLLSAGGSWNATNIAEDTIIYSSMTTGYNDAGGTIQNATAVKQVEIDSFSLVSTVPEPSAYALIVGMLALGSVMIRRHHR
ncbi:hypothetical protein N9Q19_01390 [Puniceicoccaceae bacterium]|nr:hypothetical protein [Puniceicoccaceae bacterium]